MPSARENSALWDYVVIHSVTLPPAGVHGYARVKAPIQWDNDAKKAKGQNGARTTTQGRKQSSVDIEIEIQDGVTATGESQYDLTQAAIDELISKGPGPFGIAHGATDAGRVRDIVIDEIGSPEYDAGRIRWSIKAKRWDAPVSGVGGSVGGASTANAADIKALQDYIAQLQAKIASNGAGSPFNPVLQQEIAAAQAKITQLKSSATKTPDKSNGTKQYYQDGNQPNKPGIPLGEIQP